MEANRLTHTSGKRLKLLLATAIFLITFLIFRASPVREMTDSNYTMLTSQTLFQYHTFKLDRYRFPDIRNCLSDRIRQQSSFLLLSARHAGAFVALRGFDEEVGSVSRE